MDQRTTPRHPKHCRFCDWAPAYERDKLSRVVGNYQQQALEVLRPAAGEFFLDVGCGTGAAVRSAADTAETAMGVDACPRMIAHAHRLAAGLQRVDFVVADADRLPLADGAVSALLCTAVMRHVSDRTAVVREMARVLVPGGRVVVGDFVPDLAFTGRRSARHRAREAAAASLRHPDLRVVSHVVSAGFLGPYLITSATKTYHRPHGADRTIRSFRSDNGRSTMHVERSRLVEILRHRGSRQPAQAVEERLPEHTDTGRDARLFSQCGIDPNVLEALVAPRET